MKKKFFIGLFIFAAVGLFVFAHLVLKSPEVKQVQEPALQAPIEIPATGIMGLNEALKSNKPVVAMFYVDWCTYCRRFMPVFGIFSEMYKDKFSFAAINCEDPANEEILKNYSIWGYPTISIIDRKFDYEYATNPMITTSPEIFKQELDKYLKLRAKLLK